MSTFAQLLLLGLGLAILIKLVKGEKISVGKMLLWLLVLFVFFPLIVPILSFIGVVVAGVGIFFLVLVMIAFACLAMLFS